MQKRKHSALEALANLVAGIVVSYCLQVLLYGSMGIQVSKGQNATITAAFTAASFVRSYAIRRLFNLKSKQRKNSDAKA